jgi:hypothetical protein
VTVGRYVSDLEVGDRLGPVEYVMTPFIVHEYAHGVEFDHEYFYGASPEGHIAPPTLVHTDKLRLFAASCPGGDGPHARLHYEYDATWHEPIPVSTRIRTQGEVIDRYEKRGRTFIVLLIELRGADDNKLYVSYRDTALLAFKAGTNFDAATRKT